MPGDEEADDWSSDEDPAPEDDGDWELEDEDDEDDLRLDAADEDEPSWASEQEGDGEQDLVDAAWLDEEREPEAVPWPDSDLRDQLAAGRRVLGLVERAHLPQLGWQGLHARCDTSSPSSRLHASWSAADEAGVVSLQLEERQARLAPSCIAGDRRIRSQLVLAGQRIEVELAVHPPGDRAQLVIGRDILHGRFVVDVALQHQDAALQHPDVALLHQEDAS